MRALVQGGVREAGWVRHVHGSKSTCEWRLPSGPPPTYEFTVDFDRRRIWATTVPAAAAVADPAAICRRGPGCRRLGSVNARHTLPYGAAQQ